MVARRQGKALATRLIAETIAKQRLDPGRLTLHADRGSSMRSKPVTMLLADPGVSKTDSRPHTSNDNPFSESQFKTLKYPPDFPPRFGSIQDARSFWQGFFPWYKTEHYHSGLGLLTPEMVHHGQAENLVAPRRAALTAAARRHPERFVRGASPIPNLFEMVWINPPKTEQKEEPLHTESGRGLSQKG